MFFASAKLISDAFAASGADVFGIKNAAVDSIAGIKSCANGRCYLWYIYKQFIFSP
jgi:hypothetical protein